MITALPQAIIEIILCLLPIQEAARTSILSREWRYKWTTIPKLVFNDRNTVKRSTVDTDFEQISGKIICKTNLDSPTQSELLFDKTCDLIYALRSSRIFFAINQVLLQRKGPILDFTLSMSAGDALFEIDQIICHLSRNHPLEILRLELMETGSSELYILPVSFFSLCHLTNLYLEYCEIDHVPIFNGFGSLTSLTLDRVWISTDALLHLLSNCPSLKNLRLLVWDGLDRSFFIMELFKCLPVIEHLTTWDRLLPWIELDSLLGELPTSLIHLKYLRFQEMSFANTGGLAFLAVLIKFSPNLEKIEIEVDEDSDILEEYPVILEEYSDVWLERLIEFDIEDLRNKKLEFELELVKFILARSPNLKKVFLQTYMKDKKEEFEMLKILLRAPRASPVAEIVVHNCYSHRGHDD